MHHLSRRTFAGYVFTRASTGKIKKLEAEIKRINADSSLSASFKYRNSVRLFAMIDHAKSCLEMRALGAKINPLLFNQLFQTGSNPQSPEQTAAASLDLKEAFQRVRAVNRETERLQWVVFKLTVFAPREDVPVKERLLRVPLFARQVFDSTVKRIAGPVGMKMLDWV